jgi:5'-3' exonuclease
MVEFEADDALATAAARWRDAPEVVQVVICSPDKDLTQMVVGSRVVSLDRLRGILLDETGVQEKFGVLPESIPDYLALVGDAADGIPGVRRWGAKSAAAVLTRYRHIEEIPQNVGLWDVAVRGAKSLAASLAESREAAALYKDLATLRLDVPLEESLDDLKWRGARKDEYQALCNELGINALRNAPHRWLGE